MAPATHLTLFTPKGGRAAFTTPPLAETQALSQAEQAIHHDWLEEAGHIQCRRCCSSCSIVIVSVATVAIP